MTELMDVDPDFPPVDRLRCNTWPAQDVNNFDIKSEDLGQDGYPHTDVNANKGDYLNSVYSPNSAYSGNTLSSLLEDMSDFGPNPTVDNAEDEDLLDSLKLEMSSPTASGSTGSPKQKSMDTVPPTSPPQADTQTSATGLLTSPSAKKPGARRNPWGNLSYAELIIQAVLSSPDKRLTLAQIYDWFVSNVDYFKDKGEVNSSAGWKNDQTGKSSYWTVDLEALKAKPRQPRRRAVSMETKTMEKKRQRALQRKREHVLSRSQASPHANFSSSETNLLRVSSTGDILASGGCVPSHGALSPSGRGEHLNTFGMDSPDRRAQLWNKGDSPDMILGGDNVETDEALSDLLRVSGINLGYGPQANCTPNKPPPPYPGAVVSPNMRPMPANTNDQFSHVYGYGQVPTQSHQYSSAGIVPKHQTSHPVVGGPANNFVPRHQMPKISEQVTFTTTRGVTISMDNSVNAIKEQLRDIELTQTEIQQLQALFEQKSASPQRPFMTALNQPPPHGMQMSGSITGNVAEDSLAPMARVRSVTLPASFEPALRARDEARVSNRVRMRELSGGQRQNTLLRSLLAAPDDMTVDRDVNGPSLLQRIAEVDSRDDFVSSTSGDAGGLPCNPHANCIGQRGNINSQMLPERGIPQSAPPPLTMRIVNMPRPNLVAAPTCLASSSNQYKSHIMSGAGGGVAGGNPLYSSGPTTQPGGHYTCLNAAQQHPQQMNSSQQQQQQQQQQAQQSLLLGQVVVRQQQISPVRPAPSVSTGVQQYQMNSSVLPPTGHFNKGPTGLHYDHDGKSVTMAQQSIVPQASGDGFASAEQDALLSDIDELISSGAFAADAPANQLACDIDAVLKQETDLDFNGLSV